jgi:spore coat protein B
MVKEITVPHLQSLIGKVVRVYKGGPESRTGKLLAVKSDYLIMQTDDPNPEADPCYPYLIYYKLHHIKSISEDTKANSSHETMFNSEVLEYDEFDDFHQLLESCIYKCIRIDRGGPESRCGYLLAVGTDYLVMLTEEEGLLYCNIHHIKSISEELPNEKIIKAIPFFPRSGNLFTHIEAENFNGLFKSMRYCWVKINRGGPECIEGVLVDSSEDHLTLIVNQQVNRIATFHIRNVSLGTLPESSNDKNSEVKTETASSNNQSSDNKKYDKYERKLEQKRKKLEEKRKK